MAQACSDTKRLGNIGIHQGLVLSPVLFNMAMHGRSAKLSLIAYVCHVSYADDISILVSGGWMCFFESRLRNALEATE
ncbi:hypothetical protein HPB50_019227 [Hyalomma asiaticum]|uniref:Uncharacterized protein n=2 Tax=Hyalomma asiaticum TaxID=266040 RepID=A0ACB7RUN6_HYAAI|nr:hypothetical protein HPB50_018629 [Hyalomma asiaticum]KAH6926507.1 hypothetical protein HPB50_019227 [Hyalomma asiaticum]